MEYALRITDAGDLPEDPRDWCAAPWRDALPEGTLAALYFGSEFCEHRLPTTREALACCEAARARGVEAALLTPIARDEGLDRLSRLLAELARQGFAPTLTVNDWGVLGMLRREHPGWTWRGGRLLNRALRDPRLAADPGAARRARDPQGERGDVLRGVLASLGAQGLETDADLEGGFLGEARPGFRRTLHLPYVFATTGRHCVVKLSASAGEGSVARDLALACAAPCRAGALPERRDDTPLPLYRAGNTLFYEAPLDLALAHLPGADRLLLHREPLP